MSNPTLLKTVHPKQIENVLELSARARYEHFVVRSVDFEEVWILVNKSGSLVTRFDVDSNIGYLPVWPAKEYALAFEKCLDDPYLPEKIELSEFIEHWLDGLEEDDLMVGAIPNKNNNVLVNNPIDVKNDMLEEISVHEE